MTNGEISIEAEYPIELMELLVGFLSVLRMKMDL